MSTLIQTHFTNFFNDHKIIIIKGVDPIMDGDCLRPCFPQHHGESYDDRLATT